MERLYILLGYFLVALILLCVIYESMWAWIFAILFLFLYYFIFKIKNYNTIHLKLCYIFLIVGILLSFFMR